MTQITGLSVAILAGGKSVRFGYPKFYANFRGKPLIQWCIYNSFKISNSVFIISGRNSHSYFNQVQSFQDLYPDKGPIGGIYTALEIAQTPAIAIMPCDMPLLRPEFYQNLFNKLIDQRPIAAEYQGQIQPLVSIWPKQLSKKLKYYLNENQTNVQKVLRKMDVQICQISAKPLEFLNINTKIDYRTLLECTFVESHAAIL